MQDLIEKLLALAPYPSFISCDLGGGTYLNMNGGSSALGSKPMKGDNVVRCELDPHGNPVIVRG